MAWKDSVGAWLRPFLPTALLAVAVILFLRYAPEGMKPWQAKPGPVTVAQQPKEITKWRVRTVEVPGPERIVVLNKAELATAIKMPELNAYPGHPTAVADIQPHAGKTTVVSVQDNVGVTTILTRQEPPPFFQVKRDLKMSARYLFVGRNLIESDAEIRPLRIGPVEVVGALGVEVRRDDQSFGPRAYVGFEYRF